MFFALPVAIGDSFLVQNPDFNLLVDGGKSESTELVDLLVAHLNSEKINLVICTHYDADHINGIIELLKSHIAIDEIWLPYYPHKIIGELKGVFNKYRTICDTGLDHEHGNCRRYSWRCGETFCEGCLNEKYFHCYNAGYTYDERCPFTHFTVDTIIKLSQCYYFKSIFYNSFKEEVDMYCLIDETDSALRSRKNIKVRFFKYIENQTDILSLQNQETTFAKTMKNLVIPLNGIEVLGFVEEKPHRLMFLTPTNRHSLVFAYKNILFSADSNFKFISDYNSIYPFKKYFSDATLITVPHHGSENNDMAYKHLNIRAKFVRTNYPNIRLSSIYLNLLDDKHCLGCNKSEISIDEDTLDTTSPKCVLAKTDRQISR